MSEEYIARVLAAYREMQALGAFSLNLIRPTPAKLREECQAVFKKRYLKKDEMMLRSFFGEHEDEAAYMAAIKRCDIDKFRPLRYFLDGETAFTEDKNIALLAWLIDFEPRPYRYGQALPPFNPVADSDVKVLMIAEEHKKEAETPGSPQNEETGSKQNEPVHTGKITGLKFRNVIILLFILIMGGSVYLIQNNRSQGCMYWTGDHFQAIPCSQKLKDTLSVALDTARLSHFQMITKPDTLTTGSLGRVWYFKNDGKLEFYTSGGIHPVYTDRRLKPLTEYMLNKHILHR